MLTRALACVLAAGLAAVLLLAGGQQAALAGGGPDGANPYGNVTCDKSYSPQCTVTAGSGPSAGHPGQHWHPGRRPAGCRDRGCGRGRRCCGRVLGHAEQDVRLRPGRLPGHGADAGLPDRRRRPGRPARRGGAARAAESGGAGRAGPPDPGAAQPGDPLQPRADAATSPSGQTAGHSTCAEF